MATVNVVEGPQYLTPLDDLVLSHFAPKPNSKMVCYRHIPEFIPTIIILEEGRVETSWMKNAIDDAVKDLVLESPRTIFFWIQRLTGTTLCTVIRFAVSGSTELPAQHPGLRKLLPISKKENQEEFTTNAPHQVNISSLMFAQRLLEGEETCRQLKNEIIKFASPYFAHYKDFISLDSKAYYHGPLAFALRLILWGTKLFNEYISTLSSHQSNAISQFYRAIVAGMETSSRDRRQQLADAFYQMLSSFSMTEDENIFTYLRCAEDNFLHHFQEHPYHEVAPSDPLHLNSQNYFLALSPTVVNGRPDFGNYELTPPCYLCQWHFAVDLMESLFHKSSHSWNGNPPRTLLFQHEEAEQGFSKTSFIY